MVTALLELLEQSVNVLAFRNNHGRADNILELCACVLIDDKLQQILCKKNAFDVILVFVNDGVSGVTGIDDFGSGPVNGIFGTDGYHLRSWNHDVPNAEF